MENKKVRSYKVIYHLGDSISLKTKVKNGRLKVTSYNIIISGKEAINISLKDIVCVELFRLNGLGRMIKLTLSNDGFLFVSVVRCLISGQFAIINFLKTGQLQKSLEKPI